MNDCESLIQPALEKLLDEYQIETGDGYCTVVTPHQHPNGDLITIYIRSYKGDTYHLRDYGETYSMLRLYGVNPQSTSRQKHLDRIQNRFWLQESEDEIELQAKKDNLGKRLLDAIQAVQATSYLVYTHQSQEQTKFRTKVANFLDDSGYDVDTRHKVSGHSQPREFDISINHRESPVLLDTIHTTDDQYMKQRVDSIRVNSIEIENMAYTHGVVVDDVDGNADSDILRPIRQTLDYFFLWGEKSEIVDQIPVKI